MSNSISSYISYGYCDADPVNKVDKDGLFALTTTMLYAWYALTALAAVTALLPQSYSMDVPISLPKYSYFPVIESSEIRLPNIRSYSFPKYEIGSVWNRVKANKLIVEYIKKKYLTR